MTKKQKILLAVFLAMFIVPEVLWSPAGNFVNSFLQSGNIHPKIFRDNFLLSRQYEGLYKFIIFFQFISLILVLILLVKAKIQNKFFKGTLIAINLILVLLMVFIVYTILFFNMEIL